MRTRPSRDDAIRGLALAAGLGLFACDPAGTTPDTGRRAILVSFDSFNPIRFRATLDSSVIPSFTRLFREGACAPYALTQWATQTPMAHAALWTGAFAHRNGVGRHEAALPESAWSWTERRPPASLYDAGHLAAEPLWITAGRQGRSVVAHHPTHAPQPPAYRPIDPAVPDSARAAWRREAEAVLARVDVLVLNGYNRRHPPRVLTAATHPVRGAGRWSGADTLGAVHEIAWDAGPDSLFALLLGGGRMLVAPGRDAARGVLVRAVPAAPASTPRDTAAAAFAGPIRLIEDGIPTAVSIRLFELSDDGRRFTLYQTGAELIESNHADLTARYVETTGGWIGNAYAQGLGDWLGHGGDGITEARQLDIYAFLMRQWLRGTRFAWSRAPDLLIDYNSSADSFDHEWFGWIAPERPGYDPALAEQVQQVRETGFRLLDRHLELLMTFASEDPGTLLFVTSDHGMRPVWAAVSPNAILARAGLLAVDADGEIDLTRTRVLSPDGWGVVVNRASRKGGTVPPAREAALLARARAALEAARGPDGDPLVERLYTRTELDSLFGSGPASNAFYISWRRGLRGEPDLTFDDAGAPVFHRMLPAPRGDHGATLPYVEGQAGFCVFGRAVRPGTLPVMRQTDVAPTIAEWLSIEPPRHAEGRALRLGARRGGERN